MKRKLRWLPGAALGMGLAGLGTVCAAAPNSAQFDIVRQIQGEGANVTITGKVWVKGNKVRMQSNNPMAGDILMISDGKDIYVLSPAQKAGRKQPVPSANGKKLTPWQMVTQDVSKLRSKGKKVGRETIEGQACDVYSGSESQQGATSSFKVWIANLQNSLIPMKLVAKESMSRPGASISRTQTLLLKNLKTNVPVADSQFVIPKGYKIAEGPAGGPVPGMPRPGRP